MGRGRDGCVSGWVWMWVWVDGHGCESVWMGGSVDLVGCVGVVLCDTLVYLDIAIQGVFVCSMSYTCAIQESVSFVKKKLKSFCIVF